MSYEFDCPACRRSFSPSGSGYESRLTSSNPSASALKKKRRHKYPKKFFPTRFNRLRLKIAWIHKREFYSSSGEPMSTQAQIAANQKNSQNSTGPKSETGKAVSCRNNFRHGFTWRIRHGPLRGLLIGVTKLSVAPAILLFVTRSLSAPDADRLSSSVGDPN